MAVEGVDFAWGRPGVDALKAVGKKFAARYLSHDSTGKNLDRAEADELSAAGIWIVVVWESTANRALDGWDAGIADATEAAKQAHACGMPSDRPIYFAVDFDAGAGDQAAINSYLDGAGSVLNVHPDVHRVGIYGGYYPVKHAFDGGHVAWGWQTYAWSGGQWDSRNHIEQYSNDHTIGGVGLDFDRAKKDDYGQWKVGQGPAGSGSHQQEDDMPYGHLAEGAQAITPIALPRGRFRTIGFTADNGLQQLPPAQLRIAIGHGPGKWQLAHVAVDSTKGQTVVTFDDQAATDGISVRREDKGDVHVAFEVS